MIKGIGPVFTSRSAADPARVGNDATVVRANPVRAGESAAAAPSTVQRMVADGPPIDGSRVEALRLAIARGDYAIDPDAIARAMIAGDLGTESK